MRNHNNQKHFFFHSLLPLSFINHYSQSLFSIILSLLLFSILFHVKVSFLTFHLPFILSLFFFSFLSSFLYFPLLYMSSSFIFSDVFCCQKKLFSGVTHRKSEILSTNMGRKMIFQLEKKWKINK